MSFSLLVEGFKEFAGFLGAVGPWWQFSFSLCSVGVLRGGPPPHKPPYQPLGWSSYGFIIAYKIHLNVSIGAYLLWLVYHTCQRQ